MSPEYKSALVRKPGSNFAAGLTHGNLGLANAQKAMLQHEAYCDTLASLGLSLSVLEADPAYPDGCFVEDTAIVLDDLAVITSPGHPARVGETGAVRSELEERFAISTIDEPGTLDGGDVLRVGKRFFIGVTERTNKEGARQLQSILEQHGMAVTLIEVRRFLHLKSGVTGLDDDSILCIKEYADHEAFRAIARKLIVPDSEEYAANCLSLNGTVIIADGFPQTRNIVEKEGLKVIALNTTEFQKMDGALTCLSLLSS
ncbi:MAG: amidinotransferase [Cyanobacteria bacterium HKST-UBA02]|nr:amidinotransferase [Cyanobacteria bacterium HKST-UBA02]